MKKLVLLAVVLLLSATCTWAQLKFPAAEEHPKCNLQTMTGTYAFSERGFSSYADATGTVMSPPAPFPFWNSVDAPFATVGEITFGPDGVGKGFYWISIGFSAPTTDPIPVTVTITEFNPDCTGLLTYPVPGNPPAQIVERFISFDDGSEFRSIPATITNGVPGLAWLGEGHRISKSDEPPKFCGPHTAQGTFVLTATSIVAFDGVTGYADTWLLHQKVSRSGEFKGTLYEKLGLIPDPIKDPVYGQLTVNPDCSFSEIVYIPAIQGVVNISGIFFNEGKEFYAMSIDGFPILYSIGQGKRLDE